MRDNFRCLKRIIGASPLMLICLLLSGCILEDAQERGDVCPPGTVKVVGNEKVVSFETLDCYADYIIIPSDQVNSTQICSLCSPREDGDGALECRGDFTSCLESGFASLRQDYAHCRHYRDQGVFDAENAISLGIAFVHDQDGVSDDAEFEANRSALTCPAKYSVCVYDPDFVDETREDGIRGAYGCTVECSGDLLYCGEGDARRCVNPQLDSEYCGAKGSCSGPNAASSNWIGEDCTVRGMRCVGGKCDCREGTMHCGDDDVCIDVMGDAMHCGSCDRQCEGDDICVRGDCVADECSNYANHCMNSEGKCANSVEECGASCINCLADPNVADAECTESGHCVIKRCKENYHIYRDDDRGIVECRKNTLEVCAPPDVDDPDELRDCTQKEHYTGVECRAGVCYVMGCEPGYVISEDGHSCVTPECSGCNSETERCFNGLCLCAEGYTNCGANGCVKTINNIEHCGKCGHDCHYLSGDAVVDYGCNVANCEITECETGYFITGERQSCLENDDDNCGAENWNCQKEIQNASDVKCNKEVGKCEILACESGFHLWVKVEQDWETSGKDDECEADTPEHCGSHENNCWVEHASDVECVTEEQGIYCVTKECDDGYHLIDDPDNPGGPQICEEDTLEHCGTDRDVCPAENAQCVKNDSEEYVCQCDGTLTRCNNVCVDLDTDDANCGGCGVTCSGGKHCVSGVCECTNNTDWCSDHCVDLKTDKEHCGNCTTSCVDTQDCITGECQCPGVTPTLCGAKCVNLQSDFGHCGDCSTSCVDVQSCNSGKCQCPTGTPNLCGSKCVNTQTDVSNCGGCGTKCVDTQSCNSGKCQCPTGAPNLCNNKCVNLKTDNNNCGTCGKKCTGGQTCQNGSCQCPGNSPNWCGNQCVSYGTNSNCSGCGDVCTGGRSCQSGSCQCTGGTSWCSNAGACVNLSNNNSYCGNCSTRCGSDRTCSGGRCVCNSGYECNGSCTNVYNNNSHCGKCNNPCTGDYVCQGTSCVLSCPHRNNGIVVHVTSSLNIRTGPGTGYGSDGSLGPSANVQISCKSGGWYKMASCRWVSGDFVFVNGSTGYIHKTQVNVRKGPGSSYDKAITTGAWDGKTIEVLEETESKDSGAYWFKVRYGGVTGYLRGDLFILYDNVTGC